MLQIITSKCEHPDGCDRGAVPGLVKRCIMHGEGPRCEHPYGCDRGVVPGLVKTEEVHQAQEGITAADGTPVLVGLYSQKS